MYFYRISGIRSRAGAFIITTPSLIVKIVFTRQPTATKNEHFQIYFSRKKRKKQKSNRTDFNLGNILRICISMAAKWEQNDVDEEKLKLNDETGTLELS